MAKGWRAIVEKENEATEETPKTKPRESPLAIGAELLPGRPLPPGHPGQVGLCQLTIPALFRVLQRLWMGIMPCHVGSVGLFQALWFSFRISRVSAQILHSQAGSHRGEVCLWKCF